MSGPETSAGLRLVHHGPVAELQLDRPTVGNAMSLALAGALGAVTTELAADPGVRAVVLSATSSWAFCVGADLKERRTLSPEDVLRHRPLIRAAYGGVLALPMPVVAAVAGYALGGGFELALACDLIVADGTAVFGLPEVTVGLLPGGGGTQLLARRVGYSKAADLILTGRRIDLTEAERLGLVDRVVPDGTVGAAALRLAGQIAANSPIGTRNAKSALRQGLGMSLEAGLDSEDAAWRIAATSADAREGVAAFLDRRAPDWSAGRVDQ